jgi:penicillin G amidase
MHTRSKSISILIAIAMLLALVATTSAAPLAKNDPARGQVTIIRDEYGVPHVYGSTPYSLWYGIGYAQGQDRLWEADLFRRTGTGTLAELLGPSELGGDIQARTLWGPREFREQMLENASPETQLMFKAFADGMNAWIKKATATGQLPVEYEALGTTPRPWTTDDSIGVVMIIFARFGQSGSDELTNATQLQAFMTKFGPLAGSEVFNDTHWLNDPSATTTVPAEGAITVVRRFSAPKVDLPPGLEQGLEQWNELQQGWERNMQRLGIQNGFASNAMLIGPSLTADGRAMLLGGPQMGYSVPQISMEIGAHAGNYNADGITFAGLPTVAIGVTENFAWTFTSGISDNSDIYYEVLNPNNSGQYLFDGTYRDFDCRLETFQIRGAPDYTQSICNSVHGPVIATAPGVAFTLKIAGHGYEVQTAEAILEAQQSRTIDQISAAMQSFAPNFNFLVADRRGNIFYRHLGYIPVRAEGDNPWLPHNGTGIAEWQGFIPYDQMPHALNPEQGWMVNWNNKPAPDWNNSSFGFGDWGPVQRVNTLTHLFEGLAPGSATMDTLAEFNRLAGTTTDTPSGAADTVFVSTALDGMLALLDTSADPRLPDIAAALDAWDWLQVDADNDGRYDNPSVAVFNTWWLTFINRVFADDLGPDFDPLVTGNMAYRLMVPDPALPLEYNYLGSETIWEALTGSLIDALNALTAQYGSADFNNWLQPIAYIHWEALGAGEVPDTIWMNRGTYNQLVHTGPGPKMFGENVVSPGQSGDPFSPHFRDQLELYATWTYKPMGLTRSDLNGHIESTVHLRP